VKKQYYSQLASQFGRTDKAYEYRMQNISYVLSLMGREWLNGLRPAKNVGANVAAQIEGLLLEAEAIKAPPVAAFKVKVREEVEDPLSDSPPAGARRPTRSLAEVTTYERDPLVKAWVLKAANGTCECCRRAAPFASPDGLPFLEVHHVRQLADGGSDTVGNSVALCPNCHRELHYGADSRSRIEGLYAHISRLVRE
jgi:5-methylcytosine-specific restriction protein A